MKKLTTIIVVIFCWNISFAQNVGIGTINPNYKFHEEAGARNGIYAISSVNNSDSGAIIDVLDVISGASYRVAAVKVESKSTTDASIGVYGLHNGGGWGVAGSVKEAGTSGFGAGVYGEAGLKGFGSGREAMELFGANLNTEGTAGYFANYSGSLSGFALKTSGNLMSTGIGEANGRVLTSDANGNSTWATHTGGWTTSGNNIYNSNTGFVGIGHCYPQYALDVRNNLNVSLFMENPVVAANPTVKILRGVPESTKWSTTALYVEAAGDYAAIYLKEH